MLRLRCSSRRNVTVSLACGFLPTEGTKSRQRERHLMVSVVLFLEIKEQ